MSWDPAQYERFKDERSQPFYDLLALVEHAPNMRAIDLGCGTGDLTRVLHEQLKCASTVGVDSSNEMLGAARTRNGGVPGLSFVGADIATLNLESESIDLLFANASLQWLGEHETLFTRLAACLAPKGQFAVQMPFNQAYATHVVAAKLAERAPYAAALQGCDTPTHVLDPVTYASILYRVGLRPTRIRMEVYTHLLPSREDVVEWVRGTLLTGFRARLNDALYASFLDEYREELLRLLPDDRPFFYPFQRLLMWGRRSTLELEST